MFDSASTGFEIDGDRRFRPIQIAIKTGIINEKTTFKKANDLGELEKVDIVWIDNFTKARENQGDAIARWNRARVAAIFSNPIAIENNGDGAIVYGGLHGDGTPFTQPRLNDNSYWSHLQLQSYLEQQIDLTPIAVAPGIFISFCDSFDAERFRLQQLRASVNVPVLSAQWSAEDRVILDPLISFFGDRGRLPFLGELSAEASICDRFGNLDLAYEAIARTGDRPRWDNLAYQRRQDLLIYLCCRHSLEKLGQKIYDFPPEIENDLKAFFGTVEKAENFAKGLGDRATSDGVLLNYCEQSRFGKKLPGAFYIHHSAIDRLDPILRVYEAIARVEFGAIDGATLVKFNLDKPKISYLFYPDFDREEHPILRASLQLDCRDRRLSYRDYTKVDNPPILHRKETFVTPDYPNYERFAHLTRQEERWGLLDKGRAIGTIEGWQKCLSDRRVEICNYEVVPLRDLETGAIALPKIERHRAAIARSDLSRPVRLALEAELFEEGTTFFDYGCGYGGDVTRIGDRGYSSAGWDPYYFPDNPISPADIVNLGYVINVIEAIDERRDALRHAWELTRGLLIVAAQVSVYDRQYSLVAYGDGIITKRNTFQKYYEQEELKTYIEQTLEIEAIPVGLGIYFAFRDRDRAESFKASRFRSRTNTPRVRIPSKRFEDYEDLLTPLMKFVSDRGRLPVKGELTQEAAILAEFRNYRRAFEVVVQATDREEWDAIQETRRHDLLIYLAPQLANLPKFSQFSNQTRNDIKGLFGSYRQACAIAHLLTFSLRDIGLIADCCRESDLGLKLPDALCVHSSALHHLDPLLRLYEAVVSRIIGSMDGATLIKFHLKTHKISYLFYPDFDRDPHPALQTSMQIDLRDLRVIYRDYDTEDNPPILHRKDACVTPEYPNYEKFAKLTQQEESWGLLDDFKAIRTRRDWQRHLVEHCAELRGNRLYWRKDADPYRLKLMQSLRRSRFKRKD
ncbi:DNA phosphorothioation-associated putative methyltransferase [Oxynema aestuarii]|uniref:DNA phosphorothioation-associated putative methyltransferase n=1 Tax=Oxynema aestuarii AP17 TaxID=2064643 RepID=A0A6H1TU62_9CYAN|nr:DNA phosphorothioation-associated putative methyltransferase [Oxynema aestuarii]QIZ70144.1 DNA phosphorothioation-associated putative methyltransferase [Oxynema aestuarii AP17]